MLNRRAILALALLASMGGLFGQISPGPLSNAHKNLEGPSNCTACHTLAVGAPKFKCQNCHIEIRSRLLAKHGYHAKVVTQDNGGRQECVRCHGDHYGRNSAVIKWDRGVNNFDHRQSGYALEGKHAGLACAKCHNPSHVSPLERASIQIKDLKRTYLGLTQQCNVCHQDAHRGQLGGDCGRCHKSFQDWKQAGGFDHSGTRFPLTGLHARVDCEGCHKPIGPAPGVAAANGVASKAALRFKDTPFALCSDCHRDPHRGAFQGACHGCHDTSGWKNARIGAGFQHSLTVFPLKGLHAKLGCFECHQSANFKQPVAHEKCIDCHRDDPHTGQFKAQDCGACHVETGYKPTTFDISRHQKVAYPLAGKHAAVPCAKCHTPAGKATIYMVKHDACTACHKDAHDGQFGKAPHNGKCESCHNENGFHPSTFTLTRHQQSNFKLTGGHAATPCQACHKSPEGFYPARPARYHFESMACAACHTDPHRSAASAASTAAAKFTCEGCHSSRSWKDNREFDHSGTGFAIQGAHRALRCTECHRAQEGSGARKVLLFENTPVKCAGCHDDIHDKQFVSPNGATDCASCHREVSWKPALFDHETRARFKLAGAHLEVPCSGCHKQAEERGGRRTIFYRKAPSECAACHSDAK